jgi:hypothetical protein
MIDSLRGRGGAGHSNVRRAAMVLLGLAGLVLAAGCGAAQAAAPSAAPRTLKAEIAHDKAVVAAKYHHCSAFLASRRCPFKVATTANGHGGTLIAIDITQQTMDDCDRGRVFFFNAETFLVSTRGLAPHSVGGVEGVRAHGTKEFAVIYGVNRSRNTSCAQSGNGGTDTYVYGWNGTHMIKKSGTPPNPPKVIVGT